jgi:hypothetical protein
MEPLPETLRTDEDVVNHVEFYCLEGGTTQTELAETLRRTDNALARLFAKMLDPRGHGGWKLVLKRARRGTPWDRYDGMTVDHHFREEVEAGGKRGAVKRVAQELKMEPEAVRSALRRWNGTHSPRKGKSGRK